MRLIRLVVFVALIFSDTAFAADPSGIEIMKKADGREQGKDFRSRLTMDLDNGKGKVESREFLWFQVKTPEGFKSLIKFKTPKSMENTGLLNHSRKKGEDDIWLYLSKGAKKEPRKIATGSRDQSFLGSEFNYADFQQQAVEDFDHKLLKTEKYGAWDCYVVESISEDKDYVYSKSISWIDKKSWVPVKMELFIGGKHVKSFTVQDLAQVTGVWTVKNSKMTTLSTGKSTTLKLSEVKYNNGMAQDFFTFEKLTAEL